MIITIFRARLAANADIERLTSLGQRMETLARQMPGFIAYKDFAAEDGESVSIVEFDSIENQLAWRHNVEHGDAQRLGREQFFADYRISVCTLLRESVFPMDSDTPTESPYAVAARR